MTQLPEKSQTNTPPTMPAQIKEFEFDGYKFKVDTDLIDDVEAFEIIDRIENKGQSAAVVALFKYLVGVDGYEQMSAYFKKKDGRFRVTKLLQIYQMVVSEFDPKD